MVHYSENKLEEVCLGHLVRLKNECHNCEVDEHNIFCNKYKPMKTFRTEEKDKGRGLYSDEEIGMWY